MKQYLVIGLGRFGSSIAETLYNADAKVLAIDCDEDLVQEAINNDIVENAVTLDATDEKSLEDLGINNFDVAFVCIGTNIQSSILITLTLKDLGIKKVICKAINKQHGKVLEKIGADEIVYPETYMGRRVALNTMDPNLIEHMKFSDEFIIIEIKSPKTFVGKTLVDLGMRNQYKANIIAIKTVRGETLVTPPADTVINDGDMLIISTDSKTIELLEKLK